MAQQLRLNGLLGIVATVNFEEAVSSDMSTAIRRVSHFRDSHYAGIDVAATLDFYYRRYVRQLAPFRQLEAHHVVADVGTGYGWLACAFAMAGHHVVAVDIDAPRLAAAEEIAQILGCRSSIEFRNGGLGSLPLDDREAEVAYCIEVLEHVGRAEGSVADLARIAANNVVLTTPNRWFPVIAHDTQLPLCHWLPLPARERYARAFGRTDCENDNLFWSPPQLLRSLSDFTPVSQFLHYESLAAYRSTFPTYLPYGSGSWVESPGKKKMAFYSAIARFGSRSQWLSPSIAYVLERNVRDRNGEPSVV